MKIVKLDCARGIVILNWARTHHWQRKAAGARPQRARCAAHEDKRLECSISEQKLEYFLPRLGSALPHSCANCAPANYPTHKNKAVILVQPELKNGDSKKNSSDYKVVTYLRNTGRIQRNPRGAYKCGEDGQHELEKGLEAKGLLQRVPAQCEKTAQAQTTGLPGVAAVLEVVGNKGAWIKHATCIISCIDMSMRYALSINWKERSNYQPSWGIVRYTSRSPSRTKYINIIRKFHCYCVDVPEQARS